MVDSWPISGVADAEESGASRLPRRRRGSMVSAALSATGRQLGLLEFVIPEGWVEPKF
jgi:hypothetical protein